MKRHIEQSKKGEDRKRRRLEVEEERAVTYREFSAYGLPLEMVTSFQYLRRLILLADENWPAVVWNFARARAAWKRKMRILSREGVELHFYRFFFKSVVLAVLLFGEET